MSSSTKVYALGASRNIGYHTCVRLLRKGATVTFLLRNPKMFDDDTTLRPFIESGHVRIVHGDALNKDDVRRGWARAGEPTSTSDSAGVDTLLFTLGGLPSFSLRQGFVTSPPDLVTRALLNTLSTAPSPPPERIVAVTVAGLSKASHAALPLPMRMLYGWATHVPHEDKIGAEEVLARALGEQFPAHAPAHVLPGGWEAELGLGEGALAKKIVVIRPAVLTDGKCRADDEKGGKSYRVRVEADMPVGGGYTISRQDVAHFIAERVLGDEWDDYKGKGVSLAY